MSIDQQTFYRGALQALKDGVVGGTATIGNTHLAFLEALPDTGVIGGLQHFITKQVYRLILGSTMGVGWLADAVVSRLPLPGELEPLTRNQWLAVSSINGAFGDFLARHQRLWAMRMQFCRNGLPLPIDAAELRDTLPEAKPHLVVFVHGLCLHDRVWEDEAGASFGQAWEADRDITAIYLRYNTGRHIHDNGDRLAEQLERLKAIYPVPLQRITLVGHSMGGLVSRSACSYATERGLSWVSLLDSIATLGTPHDGAPLERIGHWVTSQLSRLAVTRAIGHAATYRSAGIKDLRHGSLRHEDWLDGHPDDDTPAVRTEVPLLPGRSYCFIAASWAPGAGETLGDGMVPVHSAHALSLVEADNITRPFIDGLNHMELPRHPAVQDALEQWLFGTPTPKILSEAA